MSQAPFETVIGLEVHLQLSTNTKIFCGCANVFGSAPNTNVCPVCLGLPGALPVLNHQALLSGIKVGLALNCEINSFIKFDRKNYYYPDSPKGYQISQFDFPVAKNGFVMIKTDKGPKRIGITRAHLEEDAGKLVHDNLSNCSLVDFNRTGTPLIEIVTEADMRSPLEAYDYLNTLKLTLEYLGVSDCDMEKGSLRCDANVSIRPWGQEKFGTKTELKNMNSFRAVKVALEYEVARHTQVIQSGGKIVQETLLWNDEKAMTIVMRSKEHAHDYRYFPDPDLVPFHVDYKVIDQVRAELPELPAAKLERFIKQYALSEYDAGVLVMDQSLTKFFESCVEHYSQPKKIANWFNGAVLFEMKERKLSLTELKLTPSHLVELVKAVEEGVVSNLAGKEVLTAMLDSGKTAGEIIKEKGLAQVSDDSALLAIVDEIIKQNPTVVEQIKQGKPAAAGFLVGQAMKQSGGKANPKKLNELITQRILNA
ncbi:MAG: Asp-tRNA(Asn)/Glu-tRNA(Gln) amidotransferase subunit GatB [Candidatus Omnitrophica bacterium]|nr:Asp-tRNA(Asn)/Glu-tRNA(Gln) amidotransferase subunit GatB [Candidatus Omnitrophota bacterium]